MDKFKFNTVEEAIEAIKNGKMVLVTDDEDRTLWQNTPAV